MINSKHRPTNAIVNLKAIQYNIKQEIKNSKSAAIFAVVKANGYGHGAYAVAKTAIASGAAGLCVSNLDEALDLRTQGITAPIIILSEIPYEYLDLAIENQITLTVASIHFLKAIGENQSLNQLKIHLKIDSGMGRIGFRDLDELKLAEQMILAYQIDLEGVFTHFATADEANETYFNQQIERFMVFKSALKTKPKFIHVSNTATTFWHHACDGNLIRFGIGMYGLNPSGHDLDLPISLKPALSLVSQLTYVKEMKPDEFISYGATYQTQENEWIGTVPIGYADGWLRRLQGFKVLVNGEFCEIVGRICMDQLMIRLPREFAIGDEVVFIGKSGKNYISAEDVASYSNTIQYEIICGLSDRIPRKYK